MSYELHYTSVAKGLKPGSRGFCTVACTAGLPGPLAERLESLSGYRPVYPDHAPEAFRNPVAHSHVHLAVGGQTYSVLSRVAPSGRDYTDRANKYAHHVALDPRERPAGGPAWLLSQPGFLHAAWEGEPRVLPAPAAPPGGDRPPGIAHAWKALTGDAGWAGALADAFLADPRRPAYLLFEPGQDLLPLFEEAIALLPPARRWDVTFSTYAASLPQGVPCLWKALVRDTPEAKAALRQPGALVIDLTAPLPAAPPGPLVTVAREGPKTMETMAEDNRSPGLLAEFGTPATTRPPALLASAGDSLYTVIPEIGPASGSHGRRRRQPGTHQRRAWQSSVILLPLLFLLLAVAGAGAAWWLYGRQRPIVAGGWPRPTSPEVKTKEEVVVELRNKVVELERSLSSERDDRKVASLRQEAQSKLISDARKEEAKQAGRLLDEARKESLALKQQVDKLRVDNQKLHAQLDLAKNADQPQAAQNRLAAVAFQLKSIGPFPTIPLPSVLLRDQPDLGPTRINVGRAVRDLTLLPPAPADTTQPGGEAGPGLVCRRDDSEPGPDGPVTWTLSYLNGEGNELPLATIKSDLSKSLIIEYTVQAKQRAKAERGGLPKLAADKFQQSVLKVTDEREDPEFLQFRPLIPVPLGRRLGERTELSRDGRFDLQLGEVSKSYPSLKLLRLGLTDANQKLEARIQADGSGSDIKLGVGQLRITLGRTSTGSALLRGTFSPALDRTLQDIDRNLLGLLGPAHNVKLAEERNDQRLSETLQRYSVMLSNPQYRNQVLPDADGKVLDSTVRLIDYVLKANGVFRKGVVSYELVAAFRTDDGKVVDLIVTEPEGDNR